MDKNLYPDWVVRKFRSRVKLTIKCWDWTRGVNAYGYGRLVVGKHEERMAHRASWEIHYGPIPDGFRVLHRCDRPICVRPSHLVLGSAADNSADMVRKGRVAHGSRLPQSKLSAADVVAIRSLKGVTQFEIARRFGISQASVSRIIHRVDWRHVP